jgi:hypothetical protein
MSERNTVLRSLHDVGLAAWFGGSLMGAVGVNGAAAQATNSAERPRIASAGWARWTPVNLTAIGAHLLGAAGILADQRGRVASQAGVTSMSATKTALTVAAMGATAYSRALGKKIENAGEVPTEGVTEPGAATPPEVATAQRQLRALQWAIPALTGALLVVSAYAGEQQRPSQVAAGVARRAARALRLAA